MSDTPKELSPRSPHYSKCVLRRAVTFTFVSVFLPGLLAGCCRTVADPLASFHPDTLRVVLYSHGTTVKSETIGFNSRQALELMHFVQSLHGKWQCSPVSYAPAVLVDGRRFTLNLQRTTFLFGSLQRYLLLLHVT